LTESEESLKIRLRNAENEIAECLTLKHMIHYRLVNSNLENAKTTFNKLVEVLYEKELGLDKE
jgi:guanylate kinase